MTAASDALDAVLARIDQDIDASLDRLLDFLRIPSVSTEAAHAEDCARAADWLAGELAALEYDVASHRAPEVPNGHPTLVAHDRGERRPGPHVLFYGHYDVQPVDPLDLWSHPPFEPSIATGANGVKVIRGRGAADDKGQLMTFVEACRAWKAVAGQTPVTVSMLFEGEEEAGSPSLAPFLERHGASLSADLALVCDTGMWDPATPAITTALRGLVGEEVVIKAADRDLHSGMYGMAARNPNALLARILADLRDDDGAVTLAGFYDGVEETPAAMKESWDRLGFDPSVFLGAIGLSQPAGESGRTALEQIWARPTAEINGMIGGYVGDGFKTVIPAEARAKVSFRLVPGQDPDRVRAAFRAHVRDRLPPDCTAEFHPHGGSPALSLSVDSPAVTAASAALAAEWDRPTALIGCGGSIPVVGAMKDSLGIDSLLVGFGLEEDNIHSPNETYRVSSFHRGARSWARILAALAEGD